MRVYLLDMGSLCGWQYHASLEHDMLGALDSWLTNFMQRMRPTHMLACFDAGRGGRELIDPEYKAGRIHPEEYKTQLRVAPEIVKSRGIRPYLHPPLEADDVIASFCSTYNNALNDTSDDIESVIVSDDKDLLCLVDDASGVSLYSPSRGIFFDEKAVRDKFGFGPERLQDYLACAGDSADNIPGIKGIGKKHATEAFKQTSSMAELFRKADGGSMVGLRMSTQKLFVAGKNDYEKSLSLVKMITDAYVPLIEELQIK